MTEQTISTTPTEDSSSAGSAVYELFIFALTLFSLLLLAAYYVLPLNAATKQAIYRSDFVISLIFLADFVHLLVRAPDKMAYLKWGWLDFLGSIPLVLPLRLARLARLARTWRVVRAREPRQAIQEFETRRARGILFVTLFIAIMVMTVSSILILEFESGTPGANIDTGDDAFWWAIVTMATVGYGDHYPVTLWGRVVAIVLMTVGVGIFGMLTSFLTTACVVSDRVRREDVEEMAETLSAMQAELVALRVLLQAGEGVERVPQLKEDEG